MKTSKFVKIDNNILLEYIYNDNNIYAEDFSILENRRDNDSRQFVSSNPNLLNTIDYQLTEVDLLSRKFAKVDLELYKYIQEKKYNGSKFIRYDSLRVHLASSYVFNEYKGFSLSLYTLDSLNEKNIYLSNFFYDVTDVNNSNIFQYNSSPLKYMEKTWDKFIEIQFPSPYIVSLQLDTNNVPLSDSINYYLNDTGISTTAPIIIDFRFINDIQVTNNIKEYYLSDDVTTSFPNVPDFENLSVYINESSNGDFFEICGIYNGTTAGFQTFINDSYKLGMKYRVEYTVTTYEENIQRRSLVFSVDDNFSEPIEFRPIFKNTTTTGIIDVELRLIDVVDDSIVYRKGSYGLKPSQVSKYSANLTKINISNAVKPKIYNSRSTVAPQSNIYGNAQVRLETVKVLYPILVDTNKVIAKTDSVQVGKDLWRGLGKTRLVIYPFDNIVKFTLAKNVSDSDTNIDKVEYFDLSNASEINLVFKSNVTEVKCSLYRSGDIVDLSKGMVIFKIPQSKILDLRNIYKSKINTFYITIKNNNNEVFSIYSGTFIIFDDINNVTNVNDTITKEIGSYIISTGNENQTATVTVQQQTIDTIKNNSNIVYPTDSSGNITIGSDGNVVK